MPSALSVLMSRLLSARKAHAADQECERTVDDTQEMCWEHEQSALGMTRTTPDKEFAAGGLATLAVQPTIRVVVLPGRPAAQAVPAEKPDAIIPRALAVPSGGSQPPHGRVRGTSSGYVGFTVADAGQWMSFYAVHWHGGVEAFLGRSGGREWEQRSGDRVRVFYLRKCLNWTLAAFELQRQIVDRYHVAGPFRVILAAADTAGAVLGNLGAGWPEPGQDFDTPVAIEPRVLLMEDLDEWPDQQETERLTLRLGARLDLTFGGSGDRHLDRLGELAGRFNPEW